MINLVDLTEWKTKKKIIKEIEENGMTVDERAWRKYVENHNKKYWDHEEEQFIVHSSKGYKLTSDKKEIIESIQDSRKRGINLLWKSSKTMKALGEVDNIRMELEEMEVI